MYVCITYTYYIYIYILSFYGKHKAHPSLVGSVTPKQKRGWSLKNLGNYRSGWSIQGGAPVR